MKISENALNVLAAVSYRGIGRAWVVKHLDNEGANNIVALLNKLTKDGAHITQSEFEIVREKVKGAVRKLERFCDGVVAIGDEDFPPYRGVVPPGQRPVALFYRGDLSLLRKANKNIAVIGLLNPDHDTETVEREVVAALVRYGATIVSGLALGCDTLAHSEALRSRGKTVAVLPSPLDDILPAANRGLADEIVQRRGLLITEYYEKPKSKNELIARYQERDRLQAFFSDCVVLTASYPKNDLGNDSGSRLAMGYAAQYSIPRSVIYDAIKDADNPKYGLNRQLIMEQRDIVVINRNNLDSAVWNVVDSQPNQKHEPNGQAELFG